MFTVVTDRHTDHATPSVAIGRIRLQLQCGLRRIMPVFENTFLRVSRFQKRTGYVFSAVMLKSRKKSLAKVKFSPQSFEMSFTFIFYHLLVIMFLLLWLSNFSWHWMAYNALMCRKEAAHSLTEWSLKLCMFFFHVCWVVGSLHTFSRALDHATTVPQAPTPWGTCAKSGWPDS